ncbi:tyrosyl-DNA phosphodiesterase-domain-containing protein [Cadophora sp. MPI-SDFR-AT-0126]|nr:tyrosyl-DNA phosphodiesterase-domain-containing protein [Leotiomycetes sp. MPI-SDFR-AT-0126]
MSDTDSDEDFKRAVDLSLKDRAPAASNKSDVIDLVSDDDDNDEDDDDLDAPLTTRKIRASQGAPTKPSKSIKAEQVAVKHSLHRDGGVSPGSSSSGTKATMDASQPLAGILGLDRKAMEAERLQRQKGRAERSQPISKNKRHASISPLGQCEQEKPSTSSKASSQVQFAYQPNEEKRQKTSHVTSNVLSRTEEESLSKTGIQYPDGIVKKTWVKGVPRLGDDIKIEEVLQKDDLQLAILSAFQVEPEWVASKLDPKTKIIWVLQAKTAAEKQNIRSMAPSNYRFCFPPMEGNINCMHSKLQLLSYPTHLRVVVPSANLTSYDWGETGVMENVCFLIDLPRLPPDSPATESTHFAEELFFFLDAMSLDHGTVNSLKKFDFSSTSHMAFVHSIGGSHLEQAIWHRTGYCGLGTAIQRLGLQTDAALDIDFLAASIGSLDETFLKSLYNAAQGDDGLVEYGWRAGKSTRNKEPCETERKLSDILNDRFRIYFPTLETVANSRGGIGCGGTICLQAKWYDSTTFPRHLMRDCQSLRPGLLMHSKMMFVRGNGGKRDSKIAWAYVGSANLSESAWGRLVKDKDTREPKLTLRNWECGVVVPVPVTIKVGSEQPSDREDNRNEPLGMDAFAGHIPVPMQVPCSQYGPRRPWLYRDH